mgnify:CR=1 FL=1
MKKFFVAIFCIVFSVYSYGHQRAAKHANITVASFNILFEYANRIPADDKQKWVNRKDNLIKIIADNGFDILGVQEALNFQISYILEKIPDYGFIGSGRSDGTQNGTQEHNAIFYRKDLFDVLDKGDFWYSDTPDIPSRSWDSPCCPRICSWGKFLCKKSGKIFYVFNSHFDHQGKAARTNSAKLLLSKIREIAGEKAVVFCTGDYNSLPTSDAVKIIVDDGMLLDSKEVSKKTPAGPPGTFYGFNTKDIPENRIDFIFITRNIKVISYTVIDQDLKTGDYASDHLPVMINVGL